MPQVSRRPAACPRARTPSRSPSPTRRSCATCIARLAAARIPHATIIETDGEHAGQLMAIGAMPGDRTYLRRYFSSLPLVGKVPKEVITKAE